MVPKTFVSFDYLTGLMTREDFIKFSHHVNFKSSMTTVKRKDNIQS